MVSAETRNERTLFGFFAYRAFLSFLLYLQLIRKRQDIIQLITSLEEIIASSIK